MQLRQSVLCWVTRWQVGVAQLLIHCGPWHASIAAAGGLQGGQEGGVLLPLVRLPLLAET